MPDAIIEADGDGRIVLVNEIAQKLFGYTRDEFLELSIESLVPEEARERHAGHMESFRQNATTRPMASGSELTARRKDGSIFPVEISLSPMQAGDRFHVIATVRDVTARRVAEAQFHELQRRFTSELEEKNRQLEERNALVERSDRLKGEFLASMSHELRSPLHTIIGFAELLLEELDGPLNGQQKRFASNIRRDSHHLLELINDLLDISKIESGRMDFQPETILLRPALENAVDMVRPHAEAKSLQLAIEMEDGTSVEADPLRLRQILTNLLGNAVKFTPERGRVTIVVTARAKKVAIAVIDSGVGIARTDCTAIFEKFYQAGATTKGIREGTGLGLAIAKRLVEMHGGRIWVCSEPNHGSVFSFTLRNGTAAGAATPHLVLIIEDKPRAAELLVQYVTPAGFRALCVADAGQAAMIANELEPEAIIIDLSLRTSEEWRMIRELRGYARMEDIPIVVVSVRDEDGESMALGVEAHLTKPVAKRQMLDELERAMKIHSTPRTVLAVDDDPLALELLGEILREGGYTAILTRSGPEALEALEHVTPKAVILDMMMPEMNGFEVLQRMRERLEWDEIPVIVLSGLELTPDDAERLKPVASAVLRKGEPWRRPLILALRKMIRHT